MAFPFIKSQGSPLWKRIQSDDSTRLRLKYDTYYHIFEKQKGTRVWKEGKEFIMLSSNDYLGLSHHPRIKEAGIEAIKKWGSSTTGARLANGGRIFHQELEEKLADFIGKPACHVFSAGYLACASAVTGFAERKDLILADKNLHSSLWSGIQLSGARCERFAHNNPSHAAEILEDEPDLNKIFVLDTNVILHDSTCIKNFEDNDIVIPISVLEELDQFKRGNEQIHFNAREFLRQLDDFSINSVNGEYNNHNGKIKVVINHNWHPNVKEVFN